MSDRGQLKRLALRALLTMDGVPLPDASLRDHIRNVAPEDALESEITQAMRELEAVRLVCGNRDEVTGRLTWTLTDRGAHKAKQL